MAANSAIKIRLYPNQTQQSSIRQNCGCCRFVYNHFLQRKKEEWENYKNNLSEYDMMKELTSLKQVYPWLCQADSQSLQQTIKNLCKAFDNFFRRLSRCKKGQKPGYPKFKKKYISRESFRIPQRMNLNPNTRILTLPKIGTISYRCDNERWRGVSGINSVTVSIDAGKFYASCSIEVDDFNPIQHKFETCGIDLGIKRPLTIVYSVAGATLNENSQGTMNTSVFGVKFSEDLRKKEERRQHYQRTMARRQKGSSNHEKARRRVARSYQKERFSRQNWIEQTSHALSSNFEVIKFEDLKISNMTRSAKGTAQNPGVNVKAKSGLNREMLRLGLSGLVLRTEQKSMTNGGQVVYINPRYTSQTCSDCGVIDKKSRRSQSKFSCVHCGYTLNADTNAARNILAA